jgi:membrane associated rhomboid family serine protease
VLYLAVFGAAIEERLGGPRFLALYLLCALGGSLAHLALQPQSTAPAVGASGAIAGLIAAHLVLFPGATLGSLAPVLFFQVAENVPALLLLLVWVVSQLLSGVAGITQVSGVAWGAHLGGFMFGLAVALVLRANQARPSTRRGKNSML